MTDRPVLDVLEEIATSVVEPAATAVDATGAFPRAGITALGEAGLLGLLSSTDVGGLGLGFAEASAVVRRLGAACGSTAMVVCMHYCGAAVIEAHGPDDVRRDIAAGRHLTTLAFSEVGSRAQFWAPLSTATADGDEIVLDAQKSWVTSAGEADSYVWSSRPVSAAEGATLWLVPRDAPGVKVAGVFDGLGLRGNASSPIDAQGARIPAANRLGEDGGGLDIALGVVLPHFQVLNASASLGLMDAAIGGAIRHVTTARLEHLDQTLADQPVVRAHVARMKIQADAASTLVDDAVVALSTGRADAPVRMLEAKALAAETAIAVTDLAMKVGGGASFRKETGIERPFRDARAAAVMGPTTDALHEFLGRALCGLPLFG
jgi:alkylation response protein AidB-like acyl-CoA dehydrogenase